MEGGGGTTLSELHQNSKRLLLKSMDSLGQLERLEFSFSTATVDSPELLYTVQRDITQIQSVCVDMNRLWRSVSAKSQVDLWKKESIAKAIEEKISGEQRRYLLNEQLKAIKKE